jgi:hypothetical protein
MHHFTLIHITAVKYIATLPVKPILLEVSKINITVIVLVNTATLTNIFFENLTKVRPFTIMRVELFHSW